MRVADVMTRDVQCIHADATLDQAAELMAAYDVGFLPVTRAGVPVGVITDRDIVVRSVSSGAVSTGETVANAMSEDLCWCLEDEPIENLASIMEDRRIRRVLALDRSGRLCGVVSLGDLAVRGGDESLTERVLEDVSSPGHPGFGTRSRIRKRSRQAQSSVVDAGAAVGAAIGFVAGAAAMYILDPDRGARRRALLRDKTIHATHVVRHRAGKGARYAQGKARGIVSGLKSRFRADDVSDAKLRERVRSAIGRAVSNPRAINVEADGGVVSLEGPILAQEVDRVLSMVRSVRGVQDVECRLGVHKHPGNHPQLQSHGRRRPAGSFASSGARVGMIAGGSALALAGASRGGLLGGLLAISGATLGIKGVMTSRGTSGRKTGNASIEVQKDIHIIASVDQVFDVFQHYENFPHFMSRVLSVRNHGNGRSHWVVAGPAGMRVSWNAEITRLEANKVIAWRSLPDSQVQNAGIIRFVPDERGGTLVDVRLSYRPPGRGIGHAVASLFRSDPKSDLDSDLLRLKTMIETGNPAHDAAQPLPHNQSRFESADEPANSRWP